MGCYSVVVKQQMKQIIEIKNVQCNRWEICKHQNNCRHKIEHIYQLDCRGRCHWPGESFGGRCTVVKQNKGETNETK